MGGFAFTIKLSDVKHNAPIDDTKFDKAGISTRNEVILSRTGCENFKECFKN